MRWGGGRTVFGEMGIGVLIDVGTVIGIYPMEFLFRNEKLFLFPSLDFVDSEWAGQVRC